MRFLGLSIFTDRQLERVKAKEQFNYLFEILKIKKLYRIYSICEELPKCDKCNENREYEVILPDGQKIVKSCSCRKHKHVYKYQEMPKDDFFFIIRKISGEVYLMEQEEYDDFRFHAMTKLDEMKDPKHWGLYTSERKAKQACKIMNEKNIVY